MRKIKLFGRSIPVMILAMLAMATVGSAALLTYYGRIQATVNVAQSVLVDGLDYTNTIQEQFDITGGSMECNEHYIINNAQQDAVVQLVSSVSGPCEVTIKYMNTLHLVDKNPISWVEIGDMTADVTYNVVGDTFAYTIDATGLQINTQYVLIYYADEPDRFVEWGGNPALSLGVFTTTSEGTISEIGVADVSDLPYSDDWNTSPDADYRVQDNYDHKRGAKLWLIPSADWNADALTAWNPATYLFETDMIRYFDNGNNKLTIPAGEFLRFDFCYDFALASYPGQCTVTTSMLPV